MTWLSSAQRSRLARAVTQRSGGQVVLPDVLLTHGQAAAIWTTVCQGFAPSDGRLLTVAENAQLRRQALAVSQGCVRLSEAPLSLQAGLAVWALARQIGAICPEPRSSPLMRGAGIATLGIAATQIAACSLFLGGNVKGSFACSAPGGTCAPSTLIDDQALATIQNARPMVPAGPWRESAGRPVRVAMADLPGESESGNRAVADDRLVRRERRILKVVFPSYVDGAGNLHEPRIVHTVADHGAWMELSSGQPNVGEQIEGITGADTQAGPMLAAAPTSSSAGATQGSAGPVTPAITAQPASGAPDPALVSAVRAGKAAGGSAIAAIRAQVEARLAQTASSQGTGTTIATKSGVTVPLPQSQPLASEKAVTAINQPAPLSGPVVE